MSGYGLATLAGIICSFAVYKATSCGDRTQKMMGAYQNALEDMSNATTEYIRGIAVVKAFKQTTFSYIGSEDEHVAKNVSFTARQGETTAIVSSSGGGKSTIASLIPRFYDVNEGCIRIGGTDIRVLPMEPASAIPLPGKRM